jgi:hypothetical protein
MRGCGRVSFPWWPPSSRSLSCSSRSLRRKVSLAAAQNAIASGWITAEAKPGLAG